jgi:hypothetical protein
LIDGEPTNLIPGDMTPAEYAAFREVVIARFPGEEVDML